MMVVVDNGCSLDMGRDGVLDMIDNSCSCKKLFI